jgi:hypothetical protein
MANTIITKNSATATAVPTAGQLVQGELAVNVTDKRLFTENSGGTVVELALIRLLLQWLVMQLSLVLWVLLA